MAMLMTLQSDDRMIFTMNMHEMVGDKMRTVMESVSV
jgi:hypothetical protein